MWMVYNTFTKESDIFFHQEDAREVYNKTIDYLHDNRAYDYKVYLLEAKEFEQIKEVGA